MQYQTTAQTIWLAAEYILLLVYEHSVMKWQTKLIDTHINVENSTANFWCAIRNNTRPSKAKGIGIRGGGARGAVAPPSQPLGRLGLPSLTVFTGASVACTTG